MVLFSTYQFPLGGCSAKVMLCFHGDCPMAGAISVAVETDLDLAAPLTGSLCAEQSSKPCSIPSGVCDCAGTDAARHRVQGWCVSVH